MKKQSKKEKAIERAIESYPDFNTQRKARSFARGYVDRIWILRGPAKYRSHFLVVGENYAIRLKKIGFRPVEVL